MDSNWSVFGLVTYADVIVFIFVVGLVSGLIPSDKKNLPPARTGVNKKDISFLGGFGQGGK
jgi:hypothetical protein